jgi:mono/diheme cytochrome c family protein
MGPVRRVPGIQLVPAAIHGQDDSGGGRKELRPPKTHQRWVSLARRPFAVLLISVVAVAAPMEPLVLRMKVPDVTVTRGKEEPVSIRSRVSDRAILVVALTGSIAQKNCDALSRLAFALEQSNVSLAVEIDADEDLCIPATAYAVRPTGPDSPLGRNLEPGSWRAIMVDNFGIVRLIRSTTADPAGLDAARQLAADWQAGRYSFITNCGHCHGDDGSDMSYPNVKTMAGISIRMKPDQILEGGQMFGAVDTANWSASLKEAVLLYIEGL